jgi:hypothetical protein
MTFNGIPLMFDMMHHALFAAGIRVYERPIHLEKYLGTLAGGDLMNLNLPSEIRTPLATGF